MKAIEEAIEQINADDEGKVDFEVEVSHTTPVMGGARRAITFAGAKEAMVFTDWALGQACSRLTIPTQYFKRCSGQLQCTQFIEWRNRLPQNWLLRCKGTTLRAVLSDKYSKINNSHIMDIMNRIEFSSVTPEAKKFYLDDKGMYFKMTFGELTRKVTDGKGKSEEYKVGIMIGNSEIGARRVSVEPFIFTQSCTNDLIVQDEDSYYHKHIWISPEALYTQVAASIAKAIKIGDATLDAYEASAGVTIDDPITEIHRLAKQKKYSEDFTREVQTAFEDRPTWGGHTTLYSVINAFTHAAKTLSYNDQVDVERFAGSLLPKRRVA